MSKNQCKKCGGGTDLGYTAPEALCSCPEVQLQAIVSAIQKDTKPIILVTPYQSVLSLLQVKQGLANQTEDARKTIADLKRRLVETEKAGEGIRQKNEELLAVNKHILAQHTEMPITKMDIDTMAIKREDLDWVKLGEKYDFFLGLAKKHGIAIVVLP